MSVSTQRSTGQPQLIRPILLAFLFAPMLLVMALPVPTLKASAFDTCRVDPVFPSEKTKCCSCGNHPDGTFFCRSGAKKGMISCSDWGRYECEERIVCEWMGVE